MKQIRIFISVALLSLFAFAARGEGERIIVQTLNVSGGAFANRELAIEETVGAVFLPVSQNERIWQGLVGAIASPGYDSGVEQIYAPGQLPEIRFDATLKKLIVSSPEGGRLGIVGTDGSVKLVADIKAGLNEIDLSRLSASVYVAGVSYGNQIVKTQKIILK